MKRSFALFALCLVVCIASIANADQHVAAVSPDQPVAQKAKPAAESKSRGEKPAPAVTDSLGLLERAVARDSTKFDNLYRLGVMYLDRDRSAEASKVLAKASSLRPKDLRTLVNLGAAYDALGQATVAQDYYKRALAVSPEDSVATCRLASSLYAQSNYNDAIDLLRTVIKRRPTAYCAYFTLGVAFADAGMYRDAIRMWRKVVDLGPGTPEAVSAIESIEVLEKFVNK